MNPIAEGAGYQALKGYLGSDTKKWEMYDSCALVTNGFHHPVEIILDQGLADELYPHRMLTHNFIDACEASGQKLKVNFRKDYDHSYYYVSTFMEEHLRHHYSILTK